MPAGGSDPGSATRSKGPDGGSGGSVKVEEIAAVVESLIESLGGSLSAGELELFSELESLAAYIDATKAEIAALRPEEVKDEFLPVASDELDAIVEATAEATNVIMDSTETIEAVIETVDAEAGRKLTDATMRIYEACGFQDITGQRITKIVKALKEIEVRVDALTSAFGTEIKKTGDRPPKGEQKPASPTDEDLLEGPQRAGEGKSQEEIDALLASFD